MGFFLILSYHMAGLLLLLLKEQFPSIFGWDYHKKTYMTIECSSQVPGIYLGLY